MSLDAADSDPLRFWRYVIAALDRLQPDSGASALALLQSPQPPPIETVLTPLLNALSTLPTDAVLVLDDYHLIDAPAIHSALTFLLDHPPPQLHLILTTRADPPLPLTRLRARGQLTELRAADLRFTAEETAAFLTELMGLPLSADDVEALEARTEGWIAGLQFKRAPRAGSPGCNSRRWPCATAAIWPGSFVPSVAVTALWSTTWPKRYLRGSRPTSRRS